MKVELGKTYEDIITGFKGVATGFCEYISGCNQALLVPKVKKDGSKVDGSWYDVQRLIEVDASQVVLANNLTPGADASAPTRGD